jgi:hypothetical protein
MKSVLQLFFILLLVHATPCFSQSKIDRSKKDLDSKPQTENTTSDNGRKSNSSNDRDNHNGFSHFAAQVFMYLTYYTVIGSYEFEDHLHSNLTDYPYANDVSGNFENSDFISPTTNYLRIDIEDQFVYSSTNL